MSARGALDETLIYNDAGLVVRQIEHAPAATATFSSPYGSFSFPEALTSVYTCPRRRDVGLRWAMGFEPVLFVRPPLRLAWNVLRARMDCCDNAMGHW
jgi:hypothetical protein